MRLVASGALYVLALATIAIVLRVPLGHDESVYALGSDFSAMQVHRPIGMQVLAAIGAPFGELGFRAVALLGTLGFLAATLRFARALDPKSAPLATAVVATAFCVLHRATELLPDAPASALVMLFAALLVEGLTAERPAWRLAWLGPLAAGAFYLRYGAVLLVIAIAVAGAIAFRRRLLAQKWPLLGGVALAVGLVIPHFVQSLDETGSLFGIVRKAQTMAGGGPFGGVRFYATAWWLWIGPVAAVFTLAGISTLRFAALAGLLSLLAVASVAHGEARYAFVPLALLVSAGATRFGSWASRRVVHIAILVGAIGSLVAVAWTLRRSAVTFQVAADAGAAIRRDAGALPCRVIGTQWAQLGWYSGCEPRDLGVAIDRTSLLPDGATYLVRFDRTPRQYPAVIDPVFDGRAGLVATEVARIAGAGRWGNAVVYRLR